MDFEHDSHISLVQLNLLQNQHFVNLPTFLQLPTHSKSVDQGCIDRQIWFDSFFDHLLKYLICHCGVVSRHVGLHQRVVEIDALSKPYINDKVR
jgi:hypothetical protein